MNIGIIFGSLLMAIGSGIAGQAWARQDGDATDLILGLCFSTGLFILGLGVIGVL